MCACVREREEEGEREREKERVVEILSKREGTGNVLHDNKIEGSYAELKHATGTAS